MERKKYAGIVQRGSGYAATLGFRTINIPLRDTEISGIYAARVSIEGTSFPAAAYADQKRGVLEAHLLDFSGDVAGQTVTIELVEKLRESEQFADEATLRSAIEGDVRRTREFFSSIRQRDD